MISFMQQQQQPSQHHQLPHMQLTGRFSPRSFGMHTDSSGNSASSPTNSGTYSAQGAVPTLAQLLGTGSKSTAGDYYPSSTSQMMSSAFGYSTEASLTEMPRYRPASLMLPSVMSPSSLLAAQSGTLNHNGYSNLLPPPTSSSSLMSSFGGSFQLDMVTQPPPQLRTRAGGDTSRNFRSIVKLSPSATSPMSYPPPFQNRGYQVIVSLTYAKAVASNLDDGTSPRPKGKILCGTLKAPVQESGLVYFSDLYVTEASARHNHQEFCLSFTLVDANDVPVKECPTVLSSPFYAFSHPKVLHRIQQVEAKALSLSMSKASGAKQRVNVVGQTFIPTTRLTVQFRVYKQAVRNGVNDPNTLSRLKMGECIEVHGHNVEFYSNTAIFFDVPACPLEVEEGSSCLALVSVSNDGRNFSNPLPFWFVSDKGGCSCNHYCASCEDVRTEIANNMVEHVVALSGGLGSASATPRGGAVRKSPGYGCTASPLSALGKRGTTPHNSSISPTTERQLKAARMELKSADNHITQLLSTSTNGTGISGSLLMAATGGLSPFTSHPSECATPSSSSMDMLSSGSFRPSIQALYA